MPSPRDSGWLSTAEQLTVWTGRQAASRTGSRMGRLEGFARNGCVWVSEVSCMTANNVRLLARQDKLPFVQHGRRRWFRRDLIEQAVAARVAQRSRSLELPQS